MSGAIISNNFAELIQAVGSDFSLTQGLGGNCSVKSGTRLFVKASGKRLAKIRDENFFHEVRLTEAGFIDDLPAQPGKPSIEVYLHALLPQKYVLHLHSTAAIAHSLSTGYGIPGSAYFLNFEIQKLPYLRPGQELMEGVRSLNLPLDGVSVILQNHGIVLAANSTEQLRQRLENLESFVRTKVGVAASMLCPQDPLGIISDELRGKALWHAEHNWKVTPDHVVFLGSKPNAQTLDLLQNAKITRDLLRVSSLNGEHEFTVIGEQLLWFVNLCSFLPMEKLSVLHDLEAQFLTAWESEKLRVSIASSNINYSTNKTSENNETS